MMEIELTVSKKTVYEEVAKTTSYTGQKMLDDDTAYDRIFTTDADQELLERFWDESRAEIAHRLAGLVSAEKMSDDGDTYRLCLALSGAFDTALQPSMQLSLFSYFVQSLAARWYAFTNKGEEGKNEARATALLDDVREKAYYKKKPSRPTYS